LIDNCQTRVAVPAFKWHMANQHMFSKDSPIYGIVFRAWEREWAGLPLNALTCSRTPKRIEPKETKIEKPLVTKLYGLRDLFKDFPKR